MMTLNLRKYKLIEIITNLADEHLISQIENFVQKKAKEDELLENLGDPFDEILDIEKIMKEQNYIPPTQEELEQIIEDAAIEESIEELIKMI